VNAVLLLEVLDHRGLDVVRPVEYVEDLLVAAGRGLVRAGVGAAGGQQQRRTRRADYQTSGNTAHACSYISVLPGLRRRPGIGRAAIRRYTLSSRCSRSQELMTCRNTSYSASLTMVK